MDLSKQPNNLNKQLEIKLQKQLEELQLSSNLVLFRNSESNTWLNKNVSEHQTQLLARTNRVAERLVDEQRASLIGEAQEETTRFRDEQALHDHRARDQLNERVTARAADVEQQRMAYIQHVHHYHASLLGA